MSKLIATTNLRREKGKLYFVKENEDGFLSVYESELKRGRTKKSVTKK